VTALLGRVESKFALNTNIRWQLGGWIATLMLQGRSSARGGQMKRRTAALMFCRNNRKNISGSIIIFLEIKKNFWTYPVTGR
jgi:hypothetical protein